MKISNWGPWIPHLTHSSYDVMFKGCLLCLCTMGFLTFVPIILRKRTLSCSRFSIYSWFKIFDLLSHFIELELLPPGPQIWLFFKKYPLVIIVFQQIKFSNLYITLSCAFQTSFHLSVDGSLTFSFIYFLNLLNSKETGYWVYMSSYKSCFLSWKSLL